ncbi:nitroreductase/quinone reductase family protein [Cryobacterium zhongshanensis]|uniref:Nitroreductase family deazaflavin-dependent oxidoreductase n=1 Tax=Cryobacterium zhongshanensis TaxID=2928153 RepID=A0AA41QWV3_9MICO|nr:nitroreductase/quinone reductase family protein [Cryobacterium zhongshanensis]MCI4659186.1 nitroreductase family deazaflavin-dependent oxidoreductase [Cryobacterium zhongshanensis]
MSDFNEQIISEFRENNGHVTTAGFGSNLVLLHTTGARTGVEHVSPVMSIRDGDAWLVVASAGGRPRHPAWYFNLLRQPETSIETPEGTVAVTATDLDGEEHARAWGKIIARAPGFAGYQERAVERRIPVLRLVRNA